MSLYIVSVILHVLAAVIWLGGIFFVGLVGGPVLRSLDSGLRTRLFKELGTRFRSIGWAAIVVLVVTGVANLHFRGLLAWRVFGDPLFWRSAYGQTLVVKLVCVVGMIVSSALHDFKLGPAAADAEPGSEEQLRLRWQASVLGRINAVLGLVLLIAAVLLARGL